MSAARRRTPQRTCIACREVRPKKELMRVVRTPEGDIELDFKGKRSGRGAYVCPNFDCLERGFSGALLDRALKTTISPETKETLRQTLHNELERRRREELKRQIGPVREPEGGT